MLNGLGGICGRLVGGFIWSSHNVNKGPGSKPCTRARVYETKRPIHAYLMLDLNPTSDDKHLLVTSSVLPGKNTVFTDY